jgi:hypothetical protein
MKMICTQCGTIFDDSAMKKGGLGKAFINILPLILGLFLGIAFFPVGLILFVVGTALSIMRIRRGAEKRCPGCGVSGKMIPVDTPKGQMLKSQFNG